jgi:hypothetical protein
LRAVSCSRFEPRGLSTLLLLVSAGGQGGDLPPLSCPPGTKLEKRPHSSEPSQVELCRDTKTGSREGPYREFSRNGRAFAEGSYRADKLHGEYRIYDDKGQLTHIVKYSNGREISTYLTRAGMENTFRKLNEKAKKNGQIMRLAVRDEHTVDFTTVTTTKFSDPERDQPAMKAGLVAQDSVCSMFAHFSNLQTYVAHYIDDSGRELLVVTILRADCDR